jgi:hypothetical protein
MMAFGKTSKPFLLGATMAGLLVSAACGSSDVSAECAPFVDSTEGATPVTIAIENDGADPIYLVSNGCRTDVEVLVRDADGNPLSLETGGCGQTCESLMDEPRQACAALCEQPPTIMIAPGGRFETTWDGVFVTQGEMPGSCYADDDSLSATCPFMETAAEGLYRAGFNVATVLSCPSAGPGEDCTCAPDESGTCSISFGYAEDASEVTGEVQYPGETQIEIVFGG